MTDGQSEACEANTVPRNRTPVDWAKPLEILAGVSRWLPAKVILQTPTTMVLAAIEPDGEVILRKVVDGDDTPPFVRNPKPEEIATAREAKPWIDLDRPIEMRRRFGGSEWRPAEIVWRNGPDAILVVLDSAGRYDYSRQITLEEQLHACVRNTARWRPFTDAELLKLAGRVVQRTVDGKPERRIVGRTFAGGLELGAYGARIDVAELLEKFELVGADGETLYKCGMPE